jgi:hypothetical protein
MYLSYVMPIAAGYMAEGKTWIEKGPFNLGAWSKPNAIFAVLGGLVLAVTAFFPPNEQVFYLTMMLIVTLLALWSRSTAIAAILLAVIGRTLGFISLPDGSLLRVIIPSATVGNISIGIAIVGTAITYFFGGEGKRFEGVPEGDKIKQRQKMIAEVESRFTDSAAD